MTGNQIVLIIVSLAILYAASTNHQAYLEHKSKEIQQTSSDKNVKMMLENHKMMLESDRKKKDILEKILQQNQELMQPIIKKLDAVLGTA